MKQVSKEKLEVIQRIAKRLAPRYKFGYHDVEDIYQQAIIFGLEALASYDSKRPLENYLAVVIANKLKTFKRDNYVRIDSPSKHYESKKNLMEPISIDSVDDERESGMYTDDYVINNTVDNEMFRIIDNNIPSELRADYLKLKHGQKIVKSRKKLIEDIVIEILERYGYETWPNEQNRA